MPGHNTAQRLPSPSPSARSRFSRSPPGLQRTSMPQIRHETPNAELVSARSRSPRAHRGREEPRKRPAKRQRRPAESQPLHIEYIYVSSRSSSPLRPSPSRELPAEHSTSPEPPRPHTAVRDLTPWSKAVHPDPLSELPGSAHRRPTYHDQQYSSRLPSIGRSSSSRPIRDDRYVPSPEMSPPPPRSTRHAFGFSQSLRRSPIPQVASGSRSQPRPFSPAEWRRAPQHSFYNEASLPLFRQTATSGSQWIAGSFGSSRSPVLQRQYDQEDNQSQFWSEAQFRGTSSAFRSTGVLERSAPRHHQLCMEDTEMRIRYETGAAVRRFGEEMILTSLGKPDLR